MKQRFPEQLAWPAVTVGALRMLNTYESVGVFEGRESRLDDLILEHLTVQKELKKLNAYEECLVRMVAEGFNGTEIAQELGCSPYVVRRKMRKIKASLYGAA